MAQAELNGRLEDDSKPSSYQTHLIRLWRKMLQEELPELNHKSPPLKKKKFDSKVGRRLDRLLGAIEEFQLDDVKDLYASGLHSSLRCLSYMRPNRIPGDDIYHFRMRSQEILNNWAPSLRKGFTIQWAMEGNSLIYIPLNDALRESTEAPNMLIRRYECNL